MTKTRFGDLVAFALTAFVASGSALAFADAPTGKCFAKDNSCAGHIKVTHNGQKLSNSCAGIPVDGVTNDECTAAGGTWQQAKKS